MQRTYCCAHKALHRMSDTAEHLAYLVGPALPHNHLPPGVRAAPGRLQERHGMGNDLLALDHRALGELIDRRPRGYPPDLRTVLAKHPETRVGDVKGEVAVVREQDQPL